MFWFLRGKLGTLRSLKISFFIFICFTFFKQDGYKSFNGSLTPIFYMTDKTPEALTSYGLSAGFERFAVSRGIPASEAARVSNALGVAKVWDELAEKAIDVFKGN